MGRGYREGGRIRVYRAIERGDAVFYTHHVRPVFHCNVYNAQILVNDCKIEFISCEELYNALRYVFEEKNAYLMEQHKAGVRDIFAEAT